MVDGVIGDAKAGSDPRGIPRLPVERTKHSHEPLDRLRTRFTPPLWQIPHGQLRQIVEPPLRKAFGRQQATTRITSIQPVPNELGRPNLGDKHRRELAAFEPLKVRGRLKTTASRCRSEN